MRRHPRCLEFTSEEAKSLGMPQNFIDNPPLIKYADLLTYMIGNEPSPERIEGYPRAAAVILDVPGADAEFAAAAEKLASAWPETRRFDLGKIFSPQTTSTSTSISSLHLSLQSSPLEIWKHLAVKLAFNCLSTGTMAAMGRIAGNWMSWVSMSNKKLIDRCIRLLVELGKIDYEEAAQRIFAAAEWVQGQDWSKSEEPSPVQVALAGLINNQKRNNQ